MKVLDGCFDSLRVFVLCWEKRERADIGEMLFFLVRRYKTRLGGAETFCCSSSI
jgi:hypothetical protein